MRNPTRVDFRRKQLAAALSSDLKDRYSRRSIPVRVGDNVKIVRGDFTGIEGKVTEIDTRTQKLYVEGVTRDKASGGSVTVPVHSSKVVITSLNLSDKWRSDVLKTERAPSVEPQEREGEK